MARKWQDVRAEAIRAGQITEKGLAEAGRVHDDRIRAYRLRQIRKEQSALQEDVARTMGVSQSRVSRIENGDIDHTEVATLRAYVESLGGELRVIADFGDDQLVVA